MNAEPLLGDSAQIGRAIGNQCIADTALLHNFVETGHAHLLNRLLNGPVCLSLAVLDYSEYQQRVFDRERPRSEVLSALYSLMNESGPTVHPGVHLIENFVQGEGVLWDPISLDHNELELAFGFRDRSSVRERMRAANCSRVRHRGTLSRAGAEAVALALTRNLTLLTEDRAAVDLVKCLYPSVTVLRTSDLLLCAAELGHVTCEEAAHIFNDLLPRVRNYPLPRDGRRMRLRCHPLVYE